MFNIFSKLIKNKPSLLSPALKSTSKKLATATIVMVSTLTVSIGYLVILALLLTPVVLYALFIAANFSLALFFFSALTVPLCTFAITLYFNFTYNVLKLSNFFLTKIGLPKFKIELREDDASIAQALKIRKDKIAKIKKELEIYEKYNQDLDAATEELKNSSPDSSISSDYKYALSAYISRIIEEYVNHLEEQNIEVCKVEFNTHDVQKINCFIHWYLLRTRHRLVEWTFSKEFALHQMQQNKDKLLLGVSDENIAKLESNSKWCCSITSELMRTPVYAVLSNGEKRYFELLNIQKWLSRPVKNPSDREIFPENREKITELIVDFDLLDEIHKAVLKTKDEPSSASIKSSDAGFSYFIGGLLYITKPIFLFLKLFGALLFTSETTTLDKNDLIALENPYITVEINGSTKGVAIPKEPPLWEKVYRSLTYQRRGRGATLHEVMLDQELGAEINIHDIGRYMVDNQIVIVSRAIEHVSQRSFRSEFDSVRSFLPTWAERNATGVFSLRSDNDSMILPNNPNFRLRNLELIQRFFA